jgi:DNA-binding PadR family transcriptional regulator
LSTITILKAIANGYRHGFDIIDITGLPGGTVYPALGKLETDGFVYSRWEDQKTAQEEGRPPRRYYDLRPAGERLLAETLRQLREIERLPMHPGTRPRRA